MLPHNQNRTIKITLLLIALAIASHSCAAAQTPNPKSKIQNLESPPPAPGRMLVTGRVLDPQGKPVPGAMIMLHARNLALALPGSLRLQPIPIGKARADASGHFQLDAPRTSSSRYFANLGAVALASGYGAAWAELDVDAEEPTADITLRPEQIIHGRLLDLQGGPVPEVTVSVRSIAPSSRRIRPPVGNPSRAPRSGGARSTTSRPGPGR